MIQTAEFEFNDDLMALRSLVREFCREFSPESVVRAHMESPAGFDRQLWRRIGTELGVLGLSAPTAYGGTEAGLVAMAVAIEELGAALVCGPVVGTAMLAIPTLCCLSDSAAQRDYLPAVIGGERIATVAAPLWDGGFDPNHVDVTADCTVGRWSLRGRIGHVLDASAADLILVPARTGSGVSLFAVPGDAEALRRTDLATLDLTRRQAALRFDGVEARRIADDDETPGICEHAARVAAVLVAAEQVGASQAILDRTVDYVTHRIQFGQPIASYQAVKHRCADMLTDVEYARSTAYHGAWALQDNSDVPRLAASLAKAVAAEAFCRVSAAAIQLHGGIGFTWEGTPHLYFKRAATDAQILGTPEQHLERIAVFSVDNQPRGPVFSPV
jgi:alkylation response protein AidB-like acyl-CoA dehydrogenase